MAKNYPSSIRFCSIADIEVNGQYTKWIDQWSDEITAFMINEKIVVISTVCPHFGGEIVRCPKNHDRLRCRWHDWQFDISSGKCLTSNIKGSLQRYEHHIDDDMIVVELNEDN